MAAVPVAKVFVPKVNPEPPLPEPHAVPVLESSPVTENCAQPAVPPAEETMRFVVLAVPEIVSADEDAKGRMLAMDEVETRLPARKILPFTSNFEPGVVVPNPDLDIDSVGLPEKTAWEVYTPFVAHRLARAGLPAADALRHVTDRSPLAR